MTEENIDYTQYDFEGIETIEEYFDKELKEQLGE